MTFSKAKSIRPYTDSVIIKKTGEKLIVRMKHVRKAKDRRESDSVLLKCNDGTWYSNEKVELA